MPVEIEAKMKVEDLEAVRGKLRTAGARRTGRDFEVNTFFDTEDRSLLASDEGLRIRKARNEETGETSVVMTYKGPRHHGILKSREEVELQVGELEGAVELLSKLRFKVVLSFEKRRESWELEGCKVELDELPHLGTYVEIEGPGEAEVLKVRGMLGLNDRGLVKASYAALLGEYAQEHGQKGKAVRFTGT
jgi:adenylate cyclase class 2